MKRFSLALFRTINVSPVRAALQYREFKTEIRTRAFIYKNTAFQLNFIKFHKQIGPFKLV